MAHENEYLAAIGGMTETYGVKTPKRPLPSVGDYVNGETKGKRWSGYVMSAEPGRVAVDVGGAWIAVHELDICRT